MLSFFGTVQSGSAASERGALEAAERRAAESAAAAAARYDTQQVGAEQARAHAARALPLADRAADRTRRQRDALKQLKQQLRELESRGNNSLAVFGEKMVDLCERVKAATKKGEFSSPPKGPIGHYLKVKEKKWGGALEHIIGGSIQNFCVNTPEDSRKLFQIMGQVYGSSAKPGVTCSKFLPKQHNVSKTRVRTGSYESALDSLQIADPVVANFLIDNLSLETVLLVPDHDDAVRLSDTVENVPANCSKVVTLDGSEYFPAPRYRSYGGAARPARLLHLSTADRKRQVMAEIEEAESNLKKLEAEEEELNRTAMEAKEEARKAGVVLQRLLGALHEAQATARAAAARLTTNLPQHAVLVDELNISKEKLTTLKQQLESFSETERQHKEKIDECEAKMRTLKSQIAEATTACRNLSEEIEQEKIKMDQGVSQRQTYKQRLKEDQGKLAQVEAILRDKQAVVNQKIQEALMLCPRVDNPRDKMTVMGLLKKTEMKLSSLSNTQLSRGEVAEKLLGVERTYRRTRHSLQRLSKLIEEIKNTTDKHLSFCHRVQTYIARRVQYCFQSILTVRGYSGRMEVEQARGTLELVMAGREGGRRAGSTSSLSGGERSYSTVAFMMALWECVELPFYFMDEFDVFMDNVNRKIVMELLIDHALKNKNRQFVFLTPQDASTVTAGPQISIHLMANPRP